MNVSAGIKTLQFSWSIAFGADFYRLYETLGASGETQVGANTTGLSYEHAITLWRHIDAEYRLEACNPAGCTSSGFVGVDHLLVDAIGYFKASDTDTHDMYGFSVSLSADGSTLVFGATGEDSAATGIDGDESNSDATNAGAAYVFVRSDTSWYQHAYIKASNTDAFDSFGYSVSLSGDGNTLVVGARREDSNATGINGDENNNDATNAGAAYVFVRDDDTWYQQAYIKASNTGEDDLFGETVSLSGDGNTLLVGAKYEDSAATGINGDESNNSASNAGAAYVFVRSGVSWSQQAYIKASNTDAEDSFGYSFSQSSDGNTLVVGALSEDGSATGINGDENNNSLLNPGAAYVFVRSGVSWSQQAYIKASNTDAGDFFGRSVSLSGDGNTLVVGADREASNATGVNGDESNNSTFEAGAAYVFVRSDTTWSQQAYIKASNTGEDDMFGRSVSLSGDGNILLVGALYEASNATGINGDESNNSAGNSGAAYVFVRSGVSWSQQAYIKASNTDAEDSFGGSVSLSGDGNTLVVGAYGEASNATGIDGDQDNNSLLNAGAAYVY